MLLEEKKQMIQIQNLYKTYKGDLFKKPKPSLKGLNLNVNEGEIYGFIGPNGAGKSTTIKSILGFLKPDQGEIKIFGDQGPGNANDKIGYLPEHPYFYDFLTGREILEYYAKLSGLQGVELGKAIDHSLEMVHANKSWTDERLKKYSKGMVQRIGLAQAILHKPKLLILDEPMSGLDPVGRRDVRQAILNLHSEGTTIFYSSHVLGDVQQISTKIGMIIDGKMRMEGTVDEMVQTEDQGFVVTIAKATECNIDGVTQEGLHLICKDTSVKREVLKWSIDSNVEITSIENHNTNLEDILSKEIALHG